MLNQRTNSELDDLYDIHDHTLDEPLPNKKATSSEIEVIAPARIVTPSQPAKQQHNVETFVNSEESTVEAVVTTCSSTVTEDMFDTVDDCVGCVNQISLQQEFEDALLDLPLEMHDHPNRVLTLPSGDVAIDTTHNVPIKGCGSLFNKECKSDSIHEEQLTQGTEMDLLNWCGGGFQGK
jgi:hypothetical protein